ncbi:MAG: hypothetical protein DRO93_10025 [Candidatus Thorarchaeota archaeon]|nr:MAG: hypothetical protein DRO93_10025 [Candidatus Thorarchaeota archaeon]
MRVGVMTIHFRQIPYPTNILFGHLLLSGLSHCDAERVISALLTDADRGEMVTSDSAIYTEAIRRVELLSKSAARHLTLIFRYQSARGESSLPPVIIVLEGASATGKSMLAIQLTYELGATRVLGTDTVRQVLRSLHDEAEVPELFCHTYQAHQYRQAGPETLSAVIRGFIAQCEIVQPYVVRSVERISREGAEAVVEGVHLIPGAVAHIDGVIEVLVDPPPQVHRAMFVGKRKLRRLTTVASDPRQREREFDAARQIQEYMLTEAAKNNIHVIRLRDYESAMSEVRGLILAKMEALLRG